LPNAEYQQGGAAKIMADENDDTPVGQAPVPGRSFEPLADSPPAAPAGAEPAVDQPKKRQTPPWRSRDPGGRERG